MGRTHLEPIKFADAVIALVTILIALVTILAGIEAGRRGGFGLEIAVDKGATPRPWENRVPT